MRWSEAQRSYLDRKGVLRLCTVADALPYSALDGEGRHTGMLADLLELMAQRGGISLRLEPARNWVDATARVQAGHCDVLAPAMDTAAGRLSLQFTTPLVQAPAVIATRMQDPFIERLHAKLPGPLGVVRGHPVAQQLRDAQAGIALVEVDSDATGLEMTRRGELYGHIGSMAGVAHLLLKNRWSDLKIGGRLPEDWRYALAVPAQDPALHAILQQLVDSIDPAEQQRIVDRWLALRHEPGIVAQRVWQGLAVLVALLVGVYLWNTRLRQLNLQLAQANARLLDLTLRDPLTGLYNRKYLQERVADAFGLCQRQELTFAVVMIDIDHFKSINDRYGHVFGDTCLRQMATVLSEHFQRQCDFALRYGGEEFAVVITAEQPDKILEHLQRACATPCRPCS
jgi:polar amino acid transport system substrate-binding protein